MVNGSFPGSRRRKFLPGWPAELAPSGPPRLRPVCLSACPDSLFLFGMRTASPFPPMAWESHGAKRRLALGEVKPPRVGEQSDAECPSHRTVAADVAAARTRSR